MTHEELRVEVAEAMRRAYCSPGRPALSWAELPEAARAEHLEMADAAIASVREALQEPSGEAWNAGRAQMSAGEGVLSIWRAMVAASPLAKPRA